VLTTRTVLTPEIHWHPNCGEGRSRLGKWASWHCQKTSLLSAIAGEFCHLCTACAVLTHFGSRKPRVHNNMDHLPQMSNPTVPIIQVPFLQDSRFVYDGRGLQDYPARCNFFIRNSGGGSEDLDSSAFFQSWLFFGTLIEVFKTYDIPVQYSDFVRNVDGRQIITTTYLRDYLATWVVSASRETPYCLLKDRPRSEIFESETKIQREKQIAKEKGCRIRDILEFVSSNLFLLSRNCNVINSIVWDSVLVLCTTLHNAATYIYRVYGVDFRGATLFGDLPSRLLPELFRNSRWCSREQDIVRHILDGDICVLLLCAQLDRLQGHISHTRCSRNMCQAYQVSEDYYETKHVSERCTCDFIDVGNIYENEPRDWKPSRFSQRTHPFPTITYTNGQVQIVRISPLRTEAGRVAGSMFNLGNQYTAISHVWAHGRGNPRSNALPRCQIVQLQVCI
jgi:hypothetical protein